MDMLVAIRFRREEIAKKISELQAEDAELVVAEKVVARLAPSPAIYGPSNPQGAQPSRHIDYVLQTLAHMPERWASDWSALQEAVVKLFNVEIPKSSLQPYLSNLKNSGLIVRDGPKIALKARVAKGAGPQSDGSYDPDTAAIADDDDKSPASIARARMNSEEIQRSREAEAFKRRNERNISR